MHTAHCSRNFGRFLTILAGLALSCFHASAATISVTNTANSGAGSLRDALAGVSNGDTIVFSVAGTITLTSGQLVVSNNITILGPGATSLAVNGNGAGRVFNIVPGKTVTIAGLTITNGLANNAAGAGIHNDHAILTVSNCTISGNSAFYGAGIYNNSVNGGSATLTIVNSTLSSNSAPSFGGGGIYNDGNLGSVTLTIVNSALIGNSAGSDGAGIYSDGREGSATLTIVSSTLSGNSAGGSGSGSGGGIYNLAGSGGNATISMTNSTLSGNSTGNSVGNGGGGIYNINSGGGNATVSMASCTLSGNSALNGGGIYNYSFGSGGATLNVGSTLFNESSIFKTFVSTVNSLGYNLSSDDGGGFLTDITDQINSDPMLGPLQDNGGPTFTHALLLGSPAIDKGKNFNSSTTDQRGLPRTMDSPCIANASGGDGTDIGAFELQQPCPVSVSLGNVGVVSSQFGFDIAGGSNQVVVVEASINLVSWTALATNTLGASPLHFSDPDSTNLQQRFYRAKLVP